MSSCNDLFQDVFSTFVCVQIINEEYVLLFEQKTRKEKKSIKNNEQDHGKGNAEKYTG